jgi:vacuolar-type H+-ATPase subunit I/STV1
MRYQTAKDLQEALSEEMHPQTVSSISRQLTQVMNQLFAEDKKRDRLRRKTNRDVAWEKHNAPVEDLDIELDIIEDGPMTTVPKNSDLDEKLTLLQKRIEREKREKLFFICTTVALLLYALLN